MLASDVRSLSAYGARSFLYQNEQNPICREPHNPHSLLRYALSEYWSKTGDNPVFPSP